MVNNDYWKIWEEHAIHELGHCGDIIGTCLKLLRELRDEFIANLEPIDYMIDKEIFIYIEILREKYNSEARQR